MISSASSLILD
jgi:phosphatidylinositol glycan class W